MRIHGTGFGIAVLVLFGRLMFGDADQSSATCPVVSVADSFLGFRDWGFGANDANDIFPVAIIEGGEVALQKALSMVYNDSSKYVAILFHASWCSFSRTFRPTFSILASLYPSISHLAVEESAIRPSILSKYGVHGFPALFILNSTMRVHYHGSRTLSSLEAFYTDFTRIQSDTAHQVTMNKVQCLSNFDKTEEEEDCPFSWARSPENIFRQETYLALATAFILMRLAYLLFPYALKLARFAWTRYKENLRPSRLWENPLSFLNRLTSLFNSPRDPRKRHNLQEGAKAARTWASKSLASAVPIGEASTSRGAGSRHTKAQGDV
ncbi:hypothetical protein V2J09_002939 [Rumex salicifolius]